MAAARFRVLQGEKKEGEEQVVEGGGASYASRGARARGERRWRPSWGTAMATGIPLSP